MSWIIEYSDQVEEELADDRVFSTANKRWIKSEIEQQLTHTPFSKTKHRRPLKKIPAEFISLGVPIWKLTIGKFRVVYALDAESSLLTILVLRAVDKGRNLFEEVL